MDDSLIRAKQCLQRGHAVEAVVLLRDAIERGNAYAAALLADLRVSGHAIRRDLTEARAYYGMAADLDLATAEATFVAMLANGAGGSGRRWPDAIARLWANPTRDPWAARQAALIAEMSLTEVGDPIAPAHQRVLSSDPSIATIPSFLTPNECRYLIERAADFMQPSVVVDPRTGTFIRSPLRSASVAGFPFVMEDPAIHAINRRIATATSTIYEQGEPLQVLRYQPGEEYKLHSDALPPGGEQRVVTFLVALESNFDGGETIFPRLGLTWRGQPGDALTFVNVDAAGRPDERVWHAGTQVTRGTKSMLSKWIRGGPIDLSGPPGRPL